VGLRAPAQPPSHLREIKNRRARGAAGSRLFERAARRRNEETTMFIAMNRFKVIKGAEKDFENVWLTRETHLGEMPGFIVFHLLKGPEREDHVLYSSHTMWRSHADFEAWTKSEQFRKAHARAGSNKPMYLGHPEFEGFTVLQEEKADGSRVEAAE
jgi:heme-degrading monooxygenase HmoA